MMEASEKRTELRRGKRVREQPEGIAAAAAEAPRPEGDTEARLAAILEADVGPAEVDGIVSPALVLMEFQR